MHSFFPLSWNKVIVALLKNQLITEPVPYGMIKKKKSCKFESKDIFENRD